MIEHYRNPLKLELWRHVVPLCMALCSLALALGYMWAMAAYTGAFR